MKTETMFIGYAKERGLNYSAIFVEEIGDYLLEQRVKTEGAIWQTDGGSEFIGSWNAKKKSIVIKKMEEKGIEHSPKVTYN